MLEVQDFLKDIIDDMGISLETLKEPNNEDKVKPTFIIKDNLLDKY